MRDIEQSEGRMPEEPEIVESEPEAVAPRPAQPLLSAWARLLLYLMACLVASVVGWVVGGILGLVSLVAKYGAGWDQHLEKELGRFVILSLLTAYPLLTAGTCLFVWFVDRRPLDSVGLIRERWLKSLGLGAALGIGFMVLTALIYRMTGWIRFEPREAPVGLWLFVTLLVYPLIGLTEELVFRGYLMSTLDEWRGRRTAIAVSSVLFWMNHVGYAIRSPLNELLNIPSYIAMGIAFALCRYGAGNLWFPIGLHAAYNWAGISLFGVPEIGFPSFFYGQPAVSHWLVGPPGQSGVVDLAFGLLLLTGIYIFLYRPRQQPR